MVLDNNLLASILFSFTIVPDRVLVVSRELICPFTPTGPKVSQYVKSARVKQVLADLALSPVANRYVETLTQSEYRRLAIGKMKICLKKIVPVHGSNF